MQKNYLKTLIIFLGIAFFGTIFLTEVFAQMESFRITGNQHPEIDTFFNIEIFVEGTSRASGGIFNIHGTIYEKDNPSLVMDEFVEDVYSGTNTILIDMKKGYQPYKIEVPYVIEIQHTSIISKFEFTPIEKSADAPTQSPYQSSHQKFADIVAENKALKEELEKKDQIIMEQIKVIQNLASMVKKTVFEPIMSFLSLV